MADRAVYKTGKDRDGDITKLCNGGELWSPRDKSDAIRDIENRVHSYYVPGNPAAQKYELFRVITENISGLTRMARPKTTLMTYLIANGE